VTVLSVFDRGLDEMAAGARATFGARVAATVCVGLIASAFLPWPICAAWTSILAVR
jgi:hypothetical protein